MITRAVLRGEAAGDPAARVAGLPVLLRQLLSLQDAGVAVVELAGASAVASDPRLRLRLVEPGTAPRGDAPALLARPGLVWHPDLPRRLAAAGAPADLERVALRPGEFVVAASTPAERARAERLLLGTLFKQTDGIVSRRINRPISLRVTRALLGTPVTPNQMTLLAGLIGFGGIACVVRLGTDGLLPGALLVQAQSILDGCDGEISRLTYRRSRAGEWLDQVFDDLVNLGYFATAGWALAAAGSAAAAWIAAAGTAAHVVYQVALYAALATRAGGSGSTAALRWWGQGPAADVAPGEPRGAVARLRRLVELAGRRDFFTFLYLPAVALGVPLAALAWTATVFVTSGATTALQWLLGGGPRRSQDGGR